MNETQQKADVGGATFLGIDLAWSEGNSTGLAALGLKDDALQLVDPPISAAGPSEILAFVHRYLRPITVAAVDAPLIVANVDGQRPCEKEIGRLFGKNEASAHSTNLTRDPDPVGVKLAHALQTLEGGGFSHPSLDQEPMAHASRTIVEVYPHPAQVRLFRLDKTLKYKRATGPGRQTALKEYRTRLAGTLEESGLAPTRASREFFDRDLALSGRLKQYEDQLDAVFCALLAYRFWRFGWQGTEMIGDLLSGYIAVPREVLPRVTSSAKK